MKIRLKTAILTFLLLIMPAFASAGDWEVIDEWGDSTEEEAELREAVNAKFETIRAILDDPDTENLPTIWPIKGYITSGWGWRQDPFDPEEIEFHSAVDIKGMRGDPVAATGGGVVVWVGERGRYGNLIIIHHMNDPDIQTRYAHLSGYAVKEGEEVVRGQVIGYVGCTGRCTGPHLHYEVRVNGIPQNPKYYMTR